MKYMLLIYGDETKMPKPGSPEMDAEAQRYEVFTKSIVETGQFLDGDPFYPTPTAKTVELRNGKTSKAAGPFEKTTQQLCAYYKVQADDEKEALALAARIPGAEYGTIEVRQVVEFN